MFIVTPLRCSKHNLVHAWKSLINYNTRNTTVLCNSKLGGSACLDLLHVFCTVISDIDLQSSHAPGSQCSCRTEISLDGGRAINKQCLCWINRIIMNHALSNELRPSDMNVICLFILLSCRSGSERRGSGFHMSRGLGTPLLLYSVRSI